MSTTPKIATDSGMSSSSSSSSAVADHGEFTIPADFKPENFDYKFVHNSLSKFDIETFSTKLNMLYGTSPAMVIAEFLKRLFKARIRGSPRQIILDMAFSVFVSQTVSREWAKIYATFPAESTFTAFNMAPGRTTDANVPQANWVATSTMNATAVGMLGHAIVELAPKNTSLGKKATKDGTIFSPIVTSGAPGEVGEYARICAETNKTITGADRKALTLLADHAGHLIEFVATLLENGASDIEYVSERLYALKMKKF